MRTNRGSYLTRALVVASATCFLAGCGESQETDGVHTTEQRLETEPAEAFVFGMEIPSHTHVSDIVASGRESLQISDRVELGGIASASDGTVVVGNDAILTEIVAEGAITIGHRSSISGDVSSEASVSLQATASVNQLFEGLPLGAGIRRLSGRSCR